MGVVLGLIAISFAIWGIGDIFRDFRRSTLARIGDTEITIEQFRQLYTERLQQLGKQRGRPYTLDQARAAGIDQQVVGQLISEATLDERAKKLGLSISDAEISRRIMEDPSLRGPNGRFDRTLFEQYLRQIGTTERRFVADQRRQIVRRQLAGSIVFGTQLPKAAVEAAERFQHEQRTIEFVLLTSEQAGEVPEPSPEALAKFYEERKALFRAPEYRKIVVLPLLPADLAIWLEISDAELQKVYEERRSRYVTPEARTLQQIRFDDPKEAEAAAERIRNGATFLEIATERKLTEKDIDLGSLTKDSIVDKAVADAAFALGENEVSAPIKGRFGTVLVRVVKIEPEQVRSFEEVRDQLRRELQAERARAQLLPLYDKIEDERSLGRTLAEAAASLKLAARTVEVDSNGRDPSGQLVKDIPDAERVLISAFATEAGVENDPLQVDGGYIWYEVAGITPSRDRTLEEVKEAVEERWMDNAVAERVRAKATELLQKLKQGASLADIAAAEGLQVQTRSDIRRGNPTPPFSGPTLISVFRTPKGEFGAAQAQSIRQQVLFRVVESTLPEIDPTSEEVRKVREAMTRAYLEDVFGEYIAYLQRIVGVTINQAALKQVVTGQGAGGK